MDGITDKEQDRIHDRLDQCLPAAGEEHDDTGNDAGAKTHLNDRKKRVFCKGCAFLCLALKYKFVIDEIVIYGRDDSRADSCDRYIERSE